MTEVTDTIQTQTTSQNLVTRDELKTLVEYQQRLYASIKQLNDNHKTIHDHVSKLTEAHNLVRQDANRLLQVRAELANALDSLRASYTKTRDEIQRANELLSYVQRELGRIPELEERLRKLEQR